MGCWGITAFESDAGLDAVGCIRENLPEDGCLNLENMIEVLEADEWSRPPDATEGVSHSSMMALAEVTLKLREGDLQGLDYEDEWEKDEKKFSAITSIYADRESVQWLKEYLSDTLRYSRENAKQEAKIGRHGNGWYKEQDWTSWQAHMEKLIGSIDELLQMPEEEIRLPSPETKEKLSMSEDQRFHMGGIA